MGSAGVVVSPALQPLLLTGAQLHRNALQSVRQWPELDTISS